MAISAMLAPSATARPCVSVAHRRTRVQRPRVSVRGAGDNSAPSEKGVTWGPAATWPPQPLTESGQPREEDDPKNYRGFGANRKYVGKGDPDKKTKEILDKLPFSKPQEGGTQAGGGGEGSAS